MLESFGANHPARSPEKLPIAGTELAAEAGLIAAEPYPEGADALQWEASIADARRQQELLARRLQRKTIADACLLLVLVVTAASISATTDAALRNTAIAAAVGILLFLFRRRQDLSVLARADHWRSDAVRGRGISLEEWHRGEVLRPWHERRN